ncbi:unnamed protein product [Ilex paraguariensis]|uniref:Endoplasmic reticulum transmembrane protein n=2 Tax=Ilex paraguariensis TaxID=185542 RepID=A0ABC8R281_9AQUA
MIQLLFMVMFAEMALILILLFKTPLRKLEIMALDRLKRGRAPLVMKSVAATVFVIMVYTVYTIRDIHSRPLEAITPTDQVLMANHMLEASLMGFSLFLSFMIDKLHHYIRELRLLRKTMEAAKKQNRGFEDSKNGSADELKAVGEEISTLKTKIKKLESECETKDKEVKAAESNSLAFKNQSAGFLLEYDHLLEENQNLRNQLQSIDQSLPHSDGKKNM